MPPTARGRGPCTIRARTTTGRRTRSTMTSRTRRRRPPLLPFLLPVKLLLLQLLIVLTFFARPASTAIDVSNDEHGTLATRGSYADAVRRNGPRTSSSRSSSSSSSYNDADKDMPRFARDRATTEVPVTRPTSTMRATYADAVRRNVQRAAHDVLQRVPGMRVLYSSAASVNAAGNGNVNDDDDDGRGGERTRHQAAGRLDRSPLIDRHRVTVPLVGAHHPVAKLTPEEEEAALAAKERAEKAIVDAQLRSGVSVVLTNDFLLNAQKFILGLMFKEHTGKISHGQEEAAAATAEDTPSTSDDSTDSSSSTRAQWPVILNLIVPTDLDDFELLNARDFVVAARAQNMVISGMTEPEHVSVAVSDTTGLDINIIGIDFDVQLDTTLTVKVPGFAARVFPARFEAQLRNVKFMVNVDPRFVDDPMNPRGPRLFRPIIAHDKVLVTIGDSSKMKYGVMFLSGWLFNRVSRAIWHTNNILEKILTRNLINQLVSVITQQTIPARIQISVSEIVGQILKSLDAVLHAYNIDINIFQRILLNNQHIRLVNFRSERSPVSSPSARYRHPRPRSTLDDSRLIVSYDWHLPASIHQEANTALSHAEYERLFSWSSGPYRAERKEFLEKARAANIREGRKVPRYGSSLQRIWDWMTLRRWRERRKKRRVAAAAASGADDVHATTKRLSWWQRLKNWFRWKNKRTAPPRTDSSSSTTSDEDFEDAMSSMPIFDPTTADEVDASAIVENVDVVRAPRGVWQCIADMCRFRKNDAASEDVTASGTHQHLHKRDIDMDGVNMLEDVSMKGIGLQLDRATVVYE